MTVNTPDTPLFDPLAAGYEAWFDRAPGREIFALELDCIRAVEAEFRGDWLEIGVGTGRFAAALGVSHGIDPSSEMLAFARQRGIQAVPGVGEDLHYDSKSFRGVLLVTVLPFFTDARRVFSEIERVLRPGGSLIVSLIPVDSPWGEHYTQRGHDGDGLFAGHRFYTCAEVSELAEQAGFQYERAASCLFTAPGVAPAATDVPQSGIHPGASFAALRFTLPAE